MEKKKEENVEVILMKKAFFLLLEGLFYVTVYGVLETSMQIFV